MPPEGLSENIDYNKLIDELLHDKRFAATIPGQYGDVLKHFLDLPGIGEIFQESIKMASKIKDDKMDLRKFYMKIRKLLIEMSEFYGWTGNFNLPNENIWSETDPKVCLPSSFGLFRNHIAEKEWHAIYHITNRVDTELKNLTLEDFEYLNKLHRKYTNKE